MAVRREQVIADLTDNVTPGLARMAVAAGLTDRALKSMGGTSVKTGKDLDKTADGTKKVGDSSRKAGPDIDKFSGRLRTMAEAAFVLGPALIPLGASTIPVLTASLAGLGSAAGAIGVTVLALAGLGDGLKALDTYQLAPTAENLQALRAEMEKLGPAGAHFVKFLDDLEPAFHDLQLTARAGLFPGVEDGITDLLTRLPQVRRIVADLAQGMGDLARDGGEALGGPKFTAFFDYIESDARPTLEAFARSAGNVAEGVANLLVAFAPLSRDFTGGLESATKAFARWSEGLDQNRSFQEFLAYVRDSGPAVVDLLGSLAQALAGLVHAAAPLGKAIVPALTAVAKAFAAIANSPIGPPLYTAAAALVLFNRAASLTSRGVTSLSGSFTKLGGETTTVSSKLALLGARGGIVFAGAAAVGALADSINRIDTDNLERSLTALKFGDVTPTVDKVIDSLQNLESNWNKIDFGEVATAGGLFGDTSLDKFAKNVDEVDQSLAQMVESGNADEAATLFQKISDLAAAKGVDPKDTAKRFDAYALALQNVADASGAASLASDVFSGSLGGLRGDLRAAISGASGLSDALSALNGWFDKRDAISAYRQSIADLQKSLKNGFTGKDADNLEAVGRNILQVAQSIKDPKLQQDFLAGARASLVDLASHAGPKGVAAIQRLIDKMDELGLTHAKPTADLDDQATPKLNDLDIHLRRTGGTTAKPKVAVDPGNSLSILDQIAHMLGSLHSKTIDVTVNRRGGVTSSGGGHSAPDIPTADGGTVPKSGRGYADRYRYLLADGEEVISNRHGQADRHRSLLKAINAGRRMADGGTAGWAGHPFSNVPGGHDDVSNAITILVTPIWSAANLLKALNKELASQQKAYDKAKSARDEAVSRRDSLSGTIQQSLMGGSIWDATAASTGSVWAAGATAGGPATPQSAIAALNARTDRARRFVAALNVLKGKGVTGAALQEILSEGLEATEAMAASDLGTLSTFASAFNESTSALAAASLAGGNAVEGENVRETNKELRGIRHDLQEVKAAIKDAEKANDKAQKDNAKDVTAGVSGAASAGHRRGR